MNNILDAEGAARAGGVAGDNQLPERFDGEESRIMTEGGEQMIL